MLTAVTANTRITMGSGFAVCVYCPSFTPCGYATTVSLKGCSTEHLFVGKGFETVARLVNSELTKPVALQPCFL
jgi:hypothetical protein